MKKCLILGGAGFIAGFLERRLKERGDYVVSVARKHPPFRRSVADEYNILDLANVPDFHAHFQRHHFDECYQLAGNVGGLGHINDTSHDADILTNSLKINLHTLEAIVKTGHCDKIFFASSQCVYPDTIHGLPQESDASFNTFAFGQEKLYAESLYSAYARNHALQVRVGRLGNVYGPYCAWAGVRSKAVAAICRKVAEAPYAGVVKLWGDGSARRSFTYVDDIIDGILKLMDSTYDKPLNIANPDTITIEELFVVICNTANKILAFESSEGPVGVKNRGSDNTLLKQVLDWEPQTALWHGIALTYPWINEQAQKQLTKPAA